LAIYDQFITFLVNYHTNPGWDKVHKLCEKIPVLLVDEPGLLEGFRKFLPVLFQRMGEKGRLLS
jgi:histone deacetylase complex regulatory component SIN3